MYNSIKRTLRDLAQSESMSKIYRTEWTERMRACRRAFDTTQQRQAKRLRNEHTKNK